MTRVEFMTELASLLQDISVEERVEAMQYYNNYFDDAGEDQEETIIEQLGSPAKVAAEVKAGLGNHDGESAEYRETGYADTRFEYRDIPARRDEDTEQSKGTSYNYEKSTEVEVKKAPWTNKPLKIALIVLLILVAAPIVIPIVAGVAAAVAGILIAVFAVFIALVVASAAVAIAGVALFVAGLMNLISHLAVGLALTGSGLIVTVLGVIATIASVRLCFIVYPGMIRGLVWLCKKPFQRGKAVA